MPNSDTDIGSSYRLRGAAIIYNCRELSRSFFICIASNTRKRWITRDAVAVISSEGFMKTRFALALMAFCVALAPATVRSQDPQSQYSQSSDDKGACMADALAVCGQFIPVLGARRQLPCRQRRAHFAGVPRGHQALRSAEPPPANISSGPRLKKGFCCRPTQ